MDQIVFQFVDQRGQDRHERNAQPGGHRAVPVEPCAAGHAGHREQQDAKSDGVLMLEPGVAPTQLFAGAACDLAYAGGFFGVVGDVELRT
jgi:hypothetical protein